MWSADGHELFYRNGQTMMLVAVETSPTFTAGTPEILFENAYYNPDDNGFCCASTCPRAVSESRRQDPPHRGHGPPPW